MKNLFLAFAFIISLSSDAQDLKNYLTETKTLVKQKKYAEANDRYIWFQNHSLESSPSMSGVRLSFALSDWKSLADLYPPALDSIKAMRDHKTKQLVQNNGPVQLFADVAAINKLFFEMEKTVILFENIRNADKDKARKCWFYARKSLFKYKRYDLIKYYVGDPVSDFQVIKEQRNMMLKFSSTNKETMKKYMDDSFVENSLDLINYSIAMHDLESAKIIREEAMKVVNDYRLRDLKLNSNANKK
jgi:hypothetical protein